ncbi:MAG: N-acetyltransferase [Deltaproteobacteria bacterium]|nr:N-acetyltransferase [Deltaproteobacteria bacterium]
MASPVAIDVVDLRRRSDRRRFLDVAAPIYRDHPCYVEPLRGERLKFLDPDVNPGLANLEIQAWIARRDGRDVGRITAHVDRLYDGLHGTGTGWFGFFESIDDPAVAHALLAAAVRRHAARGATEMIGPMSFTTNQECGLLVENFTRRPTFGTSYNPPYYEALLTSFGCRGVKDLYGWWMDVTTGFEEPGRARIAAFAERLKARADVVIRHAERRRYRDEWALMFDIYQEAWRDNWGYSPITREEFGWTAESARPILREELALIVEVHGQPVGFAISLPDANEIAPRNGRLFPFGWVRFAFGLRHIRHARLILLGIRPAYRKRGLESLLCIETALRARQIGLGGGEVSWTLEDNVLINRAIEAMGGRRDRTWRLYRMPLAASV